MLLVRFPLLHGLLLLTATVPLPAAKAADLDPHVVAAVQWLADHQVADGGWTFDHRAACRGRCDDPGTAIAARNAATAMALLPLLAVGQTHQDGPHRETVQRGLDFLVARAKPQSGGLSFLEPNGTMYSHGLATLALCEAYRQTKDQKLAKTCQGALDFIGYAQDPNGGGWRYMPRQPGDTSVTGWQVAAVRAGQLAGFDVPVEIITGASRFLDSVQSPNRQTYGYVNPGAGSATTASALISRIHLGGTSDDAVWRQGVAHLEKLGPSRSDLYFNFHATQAAAQRGGETWTKWQALIGKQLIESQAKEGHAAGSWFVGRGHTAARGGRLCETSLATMILVMGKHQLTVLPDGTNDP